MENSPFGPSEEKDDSKESKASSKKAKSAEALGAFIIEPKNEKAADDKEPSLLERLTGDKPEAAEASEVEAPLESLSDEERQHVESELVAAAREMEPIEAVTDPELAAADAAVASFREKILDQGEDSETAFSETIAELGAASEAPEPKMVHEAEPSVVEEDVIDLRSNTETSEPVILGNTTPERAARETEEESEEPTTAPSYLVAGSSVAYLAGRRRGRIKTEKRMVGVHRKLEKQVTALQTELTRKETVIRVAAAEKVRAQSPDRRPENAAQERPKKMPLEKIGKAMGAEAITLVARETARETRREDPEAKRTSPLKSLTEKDIITLNRQELMAVSEKIIVEGTSLRQIYETHLVGEKGLRRLVVEFLRGGNMNKALKRELIEKEIDFERDPILRDGNREGAGTDGAGTYLEKLLEKVDTLPGGKDGEIAVLKARAAHEAAEQRKRQRTRKTADTSLAAIIAILLTAIIVLLIGR